MRKYHLLFYLIDFVAVNAQAQIYYFKAPGKITVSPSSSLLPTTTVTPTSVTSNNPASTPIPYNNAFSDQINQIYQYVDRTPVATGLLKDYGISFTDIALYNGVRTASNYLFYTEWQSLYLTLYSYRFNENGQMKHPSIVGDAVDAYDFQINGNYNSLTRLTNFASGPLTHYMVGLHYQYNQFKTNAISSNLIYVSSGQIHDTPGRPSIPYTSKDAFGFAIRDERLRGGSHKFVIKNDLFLSNVTKAISSLQIDFGDGIGYRVVNFNTAANVTYSSNGVKTILFRLTYSDNTVLESQTKVEVVDLSDALHNPSARYISNKSEESFPHAGFPLPRTYLGLYQSALVTVAYGKNNGNVIRKPLIVIEGFDPFQEFSYISLVNSADFAYRPVVSGQSLSTLLENADYDLVFIDFADGGDYIQRNAFLVENVIQWVNSVKQNYNGVRQANVVLGFSMGGLVGKYALKDMENLAVTHETRLYGSFDSPHQGANIPLSFQAAGQHISNTGLGFGWPDSYYSPQSLTIGKLASSVGKLAGVSNSPAARQMAIYRVTYQSGTGFSVDNSLHTSFAAEYSQLGYPAQSRNIVVANGSECGQDQGYLPYAELLNVDSTFSVPDWATFLPSLVAPLGTLTTYPQLSLLTVPATNIDIKGQFIANALPNQATQRIYKGKMSIKQKILGLVNLNVTLSDQSFNSSASMLPLDNTGGGVYDIDEWAPGVKLPFKLKRFNFVPTFSSLDIGGGTQTIVYADLTRQYSPSAPPASPKNVKANNFVTGKPFSDAHHIALFSNENHTDITSIDGNWLFQEIQGTAAYSSCVFACSLGSLAITGPAVVCATNATFSLNNVPAGSTVMWANSSNISYVSGQGTTSYTVTRNGSGAGCLRAIVTTSTCGGIPVQQLNVWVGGYSSDDYPISGPGSACRNENVYYNTVTLSTATNYTWSWPSDWTYSSGQGTPNLALNTGSTSSGGAVTVRVANSCDAGGSAAVRFTSVSSCGRFAAISVFPNPASEELSVGLDDYDSLGRKVNDANKNVSFHVTLFDRHQQVLVHTQSNKRYLTIPVKNLPNDIYYLRVWYKEAILQREVLIKRN